jgi:hypothetical protein
MFIKTASNSVYEIDEANKKIRRLKGERDATPYFGVDGEFRAYQSINRLADNTLLIIWGLKNDGQIIAQTTRTTKIVKQANSIEDLIEVN